MRFHGWFPCSSHELNCADDEVRRKVYQSWYPTKPPPPPPDINKKATRRPWEAQPCICFEFQLCSQPTSCRCRRSCGSKPAPCWKTRAWPWRKPRMARSAACTFARERRSSRFSPKPRNRIALKYFRDGAPIMDMVIVQAGKFQDVGRMSV